MGQIKSALSIDNPPKTVGAENHSEQWWMAKCSRDGKFGWNWGQQIPPYSISYFLHKLASELRSCLGRLQIAIETSLWAEVAKCTTEEDRFGKNSRLLMTSSRDPLKMILISAGGPIWVNYSGLKLALKQYYIAGLTCCTSKHRNAFHRFEVWKKGVGDGDGGAMGCIGGGQRWEVGGLQWMDFLRRRQDFPCTGGDLQPRLLTICVSLIMHMQTCNSTMQVFWCGKFWSIWSVNRLTPEHKQTHIFKRGKATF